MYAPQALTVADAALHELRTDAEFAEMEHGEAYGASLLHYHRELSGALRQAFTLLSRSSDLTLKKRERAALQAHAADIAEHVNQDIATLREKFSAALARESVSKPGARGAFEALIGQSRNRAEIWWDGRIRLGRPTALDVAARDTRVYRRYSTWIGWTAGAVVVAGATAIPVITTLV